MNKKKSIFLACVCFWKVVSGKPFSRLFRIYLPLKKLDNRKHFLVKKWFPGKCFPFILDGKHFLKVVKNLKISYYLLIISNLVLKLIIAIYILNIFFLILSIRI